MFTANLILILMKKFAAFLTILFTVQAYSESLVGTIVPPYPKGLDGKQGACISGGAGYTHICDYAYEIIEDTAGKMLKIISKKKLPGTANPPKWKVTDEINYPKISNDTFLVIGVCQVSGEFDDSVMALVREIDAEYFDDVSWARRLDRETGKIIETSQAGIRCQNEGFDGD